MADTLADNGSAAADITSAKVSATASLEMIRDTWLLPLVDRIAELEHQTGHLEAERAQAQRDCEAQAEQVAELRQRAEVAEAEWQRLQATYDVTAAERAAAQAERDQLRARVAALEAAQPAAVVQQPASPTTGVESARRRRWWRPWRSSP